MGDDLSWQTGDLDVSAELLRGGRMTRDEYLDAVHATSRLHRYQLRIEVDEGWSVIAMWCDLYATQERNDP